MSPTFSVFIEAYVLIPAPTKNSTPPVPAIDLGILIFLGSLLLSVQNIKSSKMFIPVIIVFLLKFKTLSPWNVTLSFGLTVVEALVLTPHPRASPVVGVPHAEVTPFTYKLSSKPTSYEELLDTIVTFIPTLMPDRF